MNVAAVAIDWIQAWSREIRAHAHLHRLSRNTRHNCVSDDVVDFS
jgi:hypothetical protein